MEKIEVTGKTVEEALTNALLKLETTSDKVEYEVLEKGSSGILGIFNSKPAKILIWKKATMEDNVRDFLNDIFGAMKMEVMLRRSNFRDYYDIYSILKSGISTNNLVFRALTYSSNKLKSKNLLAMLTNRSRFTRDTHFEQLQLTYTVATQEIEDYIKSYSQEHK